MYVEEPIYVGHLLFPPQGKIVIKKAWQSKYCLLFNASKLGIERLEVYDNIEDCPKEAPNKIFTLENCIKIFQRDQHSFTIITKTWTQNFGTQTTNDLAHWIAAFQSVAFKDDSSCNLTIVEDNELYCTSGEGVFTVKLLPSDASKRCKLEPKEYTLVISSTSMKLKDCASSKTLFTWPHRYIRRYGYRGGKFTFEAGRKCDSGEGSFHLEHDKHQEIFRCLSSKMKSMRKLLSDETSALDCGDNQFQAALSMEARSRSPLPPSPTSATKYRDIDSSDCSSNLPYFTDILNSNPPSSKQLPKPKPTKPPRKNIPQHADYEPICTLKPDYDKIEIRSEAWKTMGVDDVKHSESNLPNIPITKSLENLQEIPPPVAKIIPAITKYKDSYDKLQFFGSKNELNDIQGYKKVIVPPKTPEQQPSTSLELNDYEEVAAIQQNIEAVRLADDSHLGYGMIRKVKEELPEPLQQLTPHVPHHVINDNAYAIISKPKRV